MGQQDISEKMLLDYNDVFADVVNFVCFGGKEVIKPDELVSENPRTFYPDQDKDREQNRDIAKTWTTGKVTFSFFGLENQTEPDSKMAIRVMNYDATIYRRQYDTAGPCYPVVSIVIYWGDAPWGSRRTLKQCLKADCAAELLPFVNDYKINLLSLCELQVEDIEKFRSDFKIVAEVLVHRRLHDEWKPSTQEMAHFYSITRLLTEVTHDNYYGDMVKYVRPSEDVRRLHMCELFDRARAEGRSEGLEQGKAEGLQQGIEQGMQQGMQQGRAEGKAEGALAKALETARKMLKDGLSLELILKYTGLSVEEVQALASQAV